MYNQLIWDLAVLVASVNYNLNCKAANRAKSNKWPNFYAVNRLHSPVVASGSSQYMTAGRQITMQLYKFCNVQWRICSFVPWKSSFIASTAVLLCFGYNSNTNKGWGECCGESSGRKSASAINGRVRGACAALTCSACKMQGTCLHSSTTKIQLACSALNHLAVQL